MREKEAKLKAVTDSYQELTKEFEAHYEMIAQRDAIIGKMRIQLSSAAAEQDGAESRARLNAQLLGRASERVTVLQKRDEDVKAKISAEKTEIMKIQFETTKLAEAKLVTTPEIDEDEIADLRDRLEDAGHRKSMTFQLVSGINEEARAEVNRTRQQNDSELNATSVRQRDIITRRDELVAAIRTAERMMRDEVEQLEASMRQIEESFVSDRGGSSEITELRADLRKVEVETANLEGQADNERRADEERRVILQTIKQKLDDRTKATEGELDRARAILMTQKKEMDKIEALLDAQNRKNDGILAEIEESENGLQGKPNFEVVLAQDIQKIEQVFAARSKKYETVRQRVKNEQRQIDVEIAKRRRTVSHMSEALNKCVAEARKRAEFVRRERKKMKQINIEIKGAEGELDALRRKETADKLEIQLEESSRPSLQAPMLGSKRPMQPPPPIKVSQAVPITPPRKKPTPKVNLAEIESLTNQVEKCHREMESVQKEMEALQIEEGGIRREIAALELENESLNRDLADYEQLELYLKTLRMQTREIPMPAATTSSKAKRARP